MATKLCGHENTVLSLATTSHDSPRIVSGTEGGELGLWSLDGSGVQRIRLPVVDDVTSICCSRLNPDTIYAATGGTSHSFDLRNFHDPVQSFQFNEEEINQIRLNEKENFLAACDDSGQVKVINLVEKKVYKTLRKHTNICATVAFRPSRQWDLYTGGYDSKLILWDFSRPRATCCIDMNDVGLAEHTGPHLVNPPFIHSLAVASSGQLLGCGTENGLVQVFRANKRTLEHLQTLKEHTQGVSQVYFPDFAETTLVSGGNDGRIVIWDLSSMLSKAPACNGLSSHGSGPSGAAQQDAEDQGGNVVPHNHPVVLSCIDHSDKINWLTCSSRGSQKFIVVADSTANLTLHPFPH